ncbi:MAG: ABC transporter permease [Vicinamibacterales bacterium]
MALFFFRRLLFAACLIFAVSSASVWLVSLAPGDFVTQTLGTTGTAGEAARLRARLGIDRSAGQLYVAWLGGLTHFDLGRSFIDDRPVLALVTERAMNTALLAAVALLVATVTGVGLGTYAGRHAAGWLSSLIGAGSLALLSVPPLLMSLLLVWIAARTRWLPVGGMRSAVGEQGPVDVLRHLVAPALALALPMAASFERLQARAVSDTLRARFVLATRARGVSDRWVLWRVAMKPALRTLAAVYGLAMAGLFSGSFAVEVVTAWPGLGRLMVDALRLRDVSLVAGCALAGSVLLAMATLLGDALLVLVDPRASE